ncbi:MAG: GTPase HflX [Candidatus Acetothermia bacterium]
MNQNHHRHVEDRAGKRARVKAREKAILVGLELPKQSGYRQTWSIEESLEELASLSKTAGVRVRGQVVQRRAKPDPSFYIGKGKADEVKQLAERKNVDTIIFNEELGPAQSRNLENRIGKKTVDRAQLIMDIFAQRATTKEAQLQVELAQLEYLLPRLRGWGEALERLGGGIGTRGPGETRLERDRQKVQRRIESIERKLDQAAKEWEVRRKRRVKHSIPEIAIVGYTNTGKTTLLNQLTNSGGFVENKLFATLDPLTRKLKLPDKREVLLIDTVGLIRNLPHQLIPAFRSTLKSARVASLLINVMDVTKEQIAKRWQTVNRILNEDVFDKVEDRPPVINALNKVDQLEDQSKLYQLEKQIDNAVSVSAKSGTNMKDLKAMIADKLGNNLKKVSLEIPYAQADLVEWFHEKGEVNSEEYQKGSIKLQGTMESHLLEQLKRKADGAGTIKSC